MPTSDDERILEHGTTLGVRDFIFFNSYFSEKSYLDSKILIPENSEKYILKGLSQTKKYVDPPSLSVESKIEDIDLSSFAQKNLSSRARSKLSGVQVPQ